MGSALALFSELKLILIHVYIYLVIWIPALGYIPSQCGRVDYPFLQNRVYGRFLSTLEPPCRYMATYQFPGATSLLETCGKNNRRRLPFQREWCCIKMENCFWRDAMIQRRTNETFPTPESSNASFHLDVTPSLDLLRADRDGKPHCSLGIYKWRYYSRFNHCAD